MNDSGNDKYLLTPGPLTTSLATKRAMLRDWGSRDPDFIAITRRIQDRLLAIAGVEDSHFAVPVQGSGTFGVEATLGTLIKPGQRTLVLENGAYGDKLLPETMGGGCAFFDFDSDGDGDSDADENVADDDAYNDGLDDMYDCDDEGCYQHQRERNQQPEEGRGAPTAYVQHIIARSYL